MFWLIGLGGALGAALRYWLGSFIAEKCKGRQSFPLGTWVINITGSFLLGFLANLYVHHQVHEAVWYFAGIGFCGAYTTFSTFGYETITLLQTKNGQVAFFYVFTTVFVGMIATAIGLIL